MLLTSKLLKIMFPTVVFTGIAYSFVGILQSFDEFTIPAALSIVSNGIIILYYIFLTIFRYIRSIICTSVGLGNAGNYADTKLNKKGVQVQILTWIQKR